MFSILSSEFLGGALKHFLDFEVNMVLEWSKMKNHFFLKCGLKGLSHEIDFKNFENFTELGLYRTSGVIFFSSTTAQLYATHEKRE